MLAGRVMFGISVGGFWTIAVTLGSRLVPQPMMTRATTIIAAGISIATVLGVPAGTLIAGFAGWRMAFAAIGGDDGEHAEIDARDGSRLQLSGFLIIDPKKFDALPDSVVLQWRKKGWLALVYAQLLSSHRWQNLVDLMPTAAK